MLEKLIFVQRDKLMGAPSAMPIRRDVPPAVHRLRLIWDAMRNRVGDGFPGPPAPSVDVQLARIEDVYVTDA